MIKEIDRRLTKLEAIKLLKLTDLQRMDKGLPISMGDIAKAAGKSRGTIGKWKRDYVDNPFADVIGKLGIKKTDKKSDYQSKRYLESRSQDADEALMQAVIAGKPEAIKLFKQLTGELVEKKEIRIGLSADEIARRNLEAERRIDDFHKVKYVIEESNSSST